MQISPCLFQPCMQYTTQQALTNTTAGFSSSCARVTITVPSQFLPLIVMNASDALSPERNTLDGDNEIENEDVRKVIGTYFGYLTEVNSTAPSAIETALLSQSIKQLSLSPSTETVLPIQSLLSSSIPKSYHVGTGRQLLNHILDSVLSGPSAAQHEILFVTCFWARSISLDNLAQTLIKLNRARRVPRGQLGNAKFRVRICVSSLSPLQKLFHTSAAEGYVYPNTAAAFRKLGLPPPEELNCLDIVIKSKFFRPISVLHGKFVIVDRKTLYLPSCNVSWEEWLEGMGVFEGDIVESFLEYFQATWGGRHDNYAVRSEIEDRRTLDSNELLTPATGLTPPAMSISFPSNHHVPTIFLAQPHHAAFPPLRFIPNFISGFLSKCLPFAISPANIPVPNTPQNVFISQLIRNAKVSVFIQTPNLTCPHLLDEIYALVTRPGEQAVSVEILTCQKMMVLEQLVTNGFGGPRISRLRDPQGRKMRWGATTEACVAELLRRAHSSSGIHPSNFKISYFDPLPPVPKPLPQPGDIECSLTALEEMELARQSHVKAMVVDGEVAVIGSANGDRASWYTSGEVNVMLFDRSFASGVREALDQGVGGRRVEALIPGML